MQARSKLQKFAIEHPTASLAIVRDSNKWMNDMTGEEEPVQVIWQTRVVASYTRRRDAWRALKSCGYKVEGAFWRIVPAQEREPHPFAIPENVV